MENKAQIVHIGAGVILLLAVAVVVVLYFIAPPIYNGIINAITGIATAASSTVPK